MKKFICLKNSNKNSTNNSVNKNEIKERLLFASNSNNEQLFKKFNTTENGLSEITVDMARETYGSNIVTHSKKESLFERIFKAFINPFTIVLFILAFVSTFTDIIFAKPDERNFITVIIITVMVLISGVLRFIQETKGGNATANLTKMIHTTVCVDRIEIGKKEIPIEDIVVGDIIYLSAGDMIPADIRILSAKDLFISQSAITGESEPVEKYSERKECNNTLIEISNLAFMGSNVISGSGKAIVIATGNNTILGNIAKEISVKSPKTSFEKGINSVSWLLIRFMLIMVPIVLFVNGFTKGNWMEAALFAISVAVGLTPEMLPMIVTTSLTKGAVNMSRKNVIIKNLNAIQNLGSIDILCTDKTGTLTQDKVVLEYHLDIHGNEDIRVLRHAFLNSYYQTGLKNLIDIAIITKLKQISEIQTDLKDIDTRYTKVDEIPFDFERRRMSVVVADKTGKTQMITKGAVEEMIKCCSFAEYNGKVEPLTDEIKSFIIKKSDELNANGMRVIAVAHKTNPSPIGQFSVKDENDMVLIGYLAFLDPPKETTADAIKALQEYGVSVKILTGDNEKVTACICRQVGLEVNELVLGTDIDNIDDLELTEIAEKTTVFAKLSPPQKARVVRLLCENGHSVGYMGDGINDAAAMKSSDVGISVDTAVDIAKESSDVILLEKDLLVLENGIIEGRKTYANMIKYIKMTASSNFGNMFSVLVASAFLPFLPMASIHLILLNLIYDISCAAIPFDNVDKEYIEKPRKWDASSIGKFMTWMGPVSSIFDITTYIIMFFIICPAVCGGLHFNEITDPVMLTKFISAFQAGWFIESMWTQTLVIHMIRTKKIPFVESCASLPVVLMTFIGITVLTIIPFTSFGKLLGFVSLPAMYFGFLSVTIVLYIIFATILKKAYIKKYGELL